MYDALMYGPSSRIWKLYPHCCASDRLQVSVWRSLSGCLWPTYKLLHPDASN